MNKKIHNKKTSIPCKPGEYGLKSIQICNNCKKEFVKDYVDQICCLECLKKEEISK